LLIPGRQLAADPVQPYLVYYSVTLYRVDIDGIKKDDWLTDSAISFWQEYLEHVKLPLFPRANIVLLKPTMSIMLSTANDSQSLAIIGEALPDFSKSTHIFLPINNATNPEGGDDGTHWSLLLVSVIDGVAFHYDSMGTHNEQCGYNVSQKVAQLLKRSLRFTQMVDTPQQENSYDCGVFVCFIMEKLLLKRLLIADEGEKITMSLRGEPINAKKARKRLLEEIERSRKEGELRRSRSPSPFRRNSPPRIRDEHV
jgi:sentrin-specific protease 8